MRTELLQPFCGRCGQRCGAFDYRDRRYEPPRLCAECVIDRSWGSRFFLPALVVASLALLGFALWLTVTTLASGEAAGFAIFLDLALGSCIYGLIRVWLVERDYLWMTRELARLPPPSDTPRELEDAPTTAETAAEGSQRPLRRWPTLAGEECTVAWVCHTCGGLGGRFSERIPWQFPHRRCAECAIAARWFLRGVAWLLPPVSLLGLIWCVRQTWGTIERAAQIGAPNELLPLIGVGAVGLAFLALPAITWLLEGSIREIRRRESDAENAQTGRPSPQGTHP